MKCKGLIADIQHGSVHDGPGIRTTVFFKGCPLHCAWCHNPECISFMPQVMLYPNRCIGCGQCKDGCYSGARVLCGKEYTPEELLDDILLDRDYYKRGGGVTFSGGEPLAQKEFLQAVVDLCRRENIHCAVETSLICFDKAVLRRFDLVIADFKIWDSSVHKQYTGAGNEAIKAHFQMLDALDVPIVARTPVVPGIRQEIDKISNFLQKLNHVKSYTLMPYHPMGRAKRAALGIEADGFSVPKPEYMKELQQYAYIR